MYHRDSREMRPLLKLEVTGTLQLKKLQHLLHSKLTVLKILYFNFMIFPSETQ